MRHSGPSNNGILLINFDLSYICNVTDYVPFDRLQIHRDQLDNPHKVKSWKVYQNRFGVTLKFADPSDG